MSLEAYITLQEAAQRYKLDPELLTRYINDGKIQGGRFNGTFVLSAKDVRRLAKQQATKEELRARVAHLEGKAIGVREAARKYGLTDASISRWAQAGYVRIISPSEGRGHKALLDESDVAYAKELVHLRQAGQGKKVFTEEYTPSWF